MHMPAGFSFYAIVRLVIGEYMYIVYRSPRNWKVENEVRSGSSCCGSLKLRDCVSAYSDIEDSILG